MFNKSMQITAYFTFSIIIGILLYSIIQKQEPVSVVKGNYDFTPLNFTLENTNDTICKMLIRERENSAQVILANGDTYFFNDPGCMILWIKEYKKNNKIAKLWIYTTDTHRWIDAKMAWYGIRDKSVMGYGFGAREKKCKGCIDFKEMRIRMLHNETLLNPVIRKRLLEDNYDF